MNGEVQEALSQSKEAQAEAHLAMHEHMLACQSGQWDRAEVARTRAVAFIEAQLDAFQRACKALMSANGR